MTFLICMKCNGAQCSLETGCKDLRPALCGPFPDGSMISPMWLQPPEHRARINKFSDPMGESYQEQEFVQIPQMNPVRPVLIANEKTTEQIKKEHDKSAPTKYLLRTEK